MEQQEKIKELIQLIQENPELEIVPMVAYEVCGSDDFAYWMGAWGKTEIDEYWCSDERIYFRSEDEDSLVDDVWDREDEYPNISREDAEKIVSGYDWTKCICVRIELP